MSHNSLFVKCPWCNWTACFKFYRKRSVSKQLFHDIFFICFTKTKSTDFSCLFYFWYWSALSGVRTLLFITCSTSIRSTFFIYQIAIFTIETIKMWPSTTTAFVKEIAVENLLCRKIRNFLAGLQSKSWFHWLNETKSITRSTMRLITNFC